MADYTQPDVVQKRVRFFDGQFLQDQDFIDEQRYHLDRTRRLSRTLGITGVVTGLGVAKGGPYELTISPGVAIDGLGRQLVLGTAATLRLSETFARKQNIELHLIYQQTATDLAATGSKSERRWDETPKIVAIAPDGTAAVLPDGASSTWDGPTVLLGRLAVTDNGDVTVDASAVVRAGLAVPGSVGIGVAAQPDARLAVSAAGSQLQLRRENTETTGGKQLFLELYQHDPDPKNLRPEVYPSIRFHHNNRFWWRIEAQGISGFHFKDGNLASDAYAHIKANNISAAGSVDVAGTLSVTGKGGLNLDFSVNGRLRSNNNDGGLFIADTRFVGGHNTDHIGFWNTGGWRLTVNPAGNVGINYLNPESKLTVSAGASHLQLRRENTERTGGKQLFLELYQHDPDPKNLRPDVFPIIRFHHNNRFWHRIEAQGNGFHLKDGGLSSDAYSDLKANNLTGSNVFATNNIGVGTTAPPWRLSVSSTKDHLALYREAKETSGGPQIYIELAQFDAYPPKIAETYPAIRFHHHYRFWHRIEARVDGIHIKTGDPAKDDHSAMHCSTITIGRATLTEDDVNRIKQRLSLPF
jgi:hypothetical protein